MSTSPTPRSRSWMIITLLVVAVLLWLPTVALIATVRESDPAGNGLTYSFAMLSGIAMWVVLLLLVLVTLAREGAPSGAYVRGVSAVAMGAWGTLAVLELMKHEHFTLGWPIVVPVIVPLVVMLFVVWSTWPSARAMADGGTMARVPWIVVLALSLVGIGARLAQQRRLRDITVTVAANALGATESANPGRSREQAKLDARPHTSPLRDFLAFTSNGNELREAALARARALPGRHADAVAMLGNGESAVMDELRNLGLDATPEVCRAAVEFMRRHAESLREEGTGGRSYAASAFRVERYEFGLEWLAERACPLAPAVEAYETAARAYPGDPQRERWMARLARLLPGGR